MNAVSIRKALLIVVALGLVLTVTYLVFVSVRVVGGVTLEEAAPSQVMRLQVLDAVGNRGIAQDAAALAAAQADSLLEIEVVEIGEYDLRAVSRTLVVSRVEDEDAARLLAERMGLDPSEVVYRPLEHNTEYVTATLILGPDYEVIAKRMEANKELQRQS